MGYPWFSIPCQGWPEWLGIGGRIKSESVAGLCRNGWPEWLGILIVDIEGRKRWIEVDGKKEKMVSGF